jgi:predicted lipoprotein
MDHLDLAMAEVLLRPSAAAGDWLIGAIFSTALAGREDEKNHDRHMRREHRALDEAHEQAHLDAMRARYADTMPTFATRLEEARRRHGLTHPA